MMDEAPKKEIDETAYLMASEANRETLDRSILQIEAVKGIKVSPEELFK